jgi:hypothetical protein
MKSLSIARVHLLKRSLAFAAACSLLAADSLVLGRAHAGTYSFDGKCAFLLDSSYQENCTALFDDDILTIMPKGSRQVRILPQQIVFIALADQSSLKMNEGLELYNRAVPWWKPWNKLPNWVKDATKKEASNHQFSVGYVDKDFNPKILLFSLNDKAKASAMASELQSTSGLSLGQSRTADKALDSRLVQRLTKETQRHAQRLTGLCSQWMFEDAQPVADSLNTYVSNTTEEISIFDGSDDLSKRLRSTANSAFAYCDSQMAAELAKAQAQEKARLDAIRKREAAVRSAKAQAVAAAIAKRSQLAAAARAARRAAWDSLAGS